MEFADESCDSRDGCVESEEETLSFCDLPVSGNTQISAGSGSPVKHSSIELSEREDLNFDFDFHFGGSVPAEFPGCPADDLFSEGHLLPLSESNLHCSSSKSDSFRENQILWRSEDQIQVQAWRSDSLESRSSSYWTTSSSNNSRGNFNSSASHRTNSRHLNLQLSSSTSPKSPRKRTKRSLKWQQFFSVGLSKTPAMQLEDMRLRQQKIRQIEHSVNDDDDGDGKILEQKAERGRARRAWMKLGNFTSFNGCMGSVKSVVNCTTVKNRIDDHP